MSEAESLFAILRQSADAGAVNAIERLVREGRAARAGDVGAVTYTAA